MRGGGLVFVALLLTGCTGSSLLLLPDEEGGQGAVAVLDQQSGETRAVVDQGNSRSRLSADRAATRRLDPNRIRRGERSLLGGLPAKPRPFRLTFPSESAAIGPDEQLIVDEIVGEVTRRTGVEVEIIGHTDASGDAAYNKALSEQRAAAVQQALLARNVPGDAITLVAGEGEEQLAVATADGVRELLNRRVEVTVR